MSDKNHSNDVEWAPCQSGDLLAVSQRLRHSRRRQTALRIFTQVAAILVLSFGVFVAYQGISRSGDLGGVTCQEVQANLDRYAMGQLTPDEQRAIEIHLSNCPQCSERMRAMQGAAHSFGELRRPEVVRSARPGDMLAPLASEKSPEGVAFHGSLAALRLQ